MYNFGKYDAQNRYDEWNTTQVKLKLNKNTDRDILEWINRQKYGSGTSVQGAIKALIRQELARPATDPPAGPSGGAWAGKPAAGKSMAGIRDSARG